MKPVVQRIGTAVAALVLVGGVSGCGAGQDAYSQKWYNPAEGVNADAGDVAIRDLLVVTDDEGTVSVVGTLLNQADDEDELVEMFVDDQVADFTDAIELPSGTPVLLGSEGTRAIVTGLGDEAASGSSVEIELRFQSAPRTTVSTFVVADDGIYADYGPTEEPTAEAGG